MPLQCSGRSPGLRHPPPLRVACRRGQLSGDEHLADELIAVRAKKNMCSVRHTPMPSRSSSRARAASSPVSALARTPRRRSSSDHAEDLTGTPHRPEGERGEPRRGHHFPEVPSIAITSPGCGTARGYRFAAIHGRDRSPVRWRHRRRASPCPGRRSPHGRTFRPGRSGSPRAASKPPSIMGRGEGPHEDHVLSRRRPSLRFFGTENDPALGGAGRRRHATGQLFGGCPAGSNEGCMSAPSDPGSIYSEVPPLGPEVPRRRRPWQIGPRRGRGACALRV